MKVSIISLTIALTSALVAANPQTPSHPEAPARVRREPQIQSGPATIPSNPAKHEDAPARVRREPQIQSGPATIPTAPAELPGCTKICNEKCAEAKLGLATGGSCTTAKIDCTCENGKPPQ
ncbi:hypothetical protein LZ31DRAFT_595855 [Colletotrichum somersetense]|nr:hypothetical protein LZ31DRAFT_595855 [Colletotrichum somersetense]